MSIDYVDERIARIKRKKAEIDRICGLIIEKKFELSPAVRQRMQEKGITDDQMVAILLKAFLGGHAQ